MKLFVFLLFVSISWIEGARGQVNRPSLLTIAVSPRSVDVSERSDSCDLRLIFGASISGFSGGLITWRNDEDDRQEETLVRAGARVTQSHLLAKDFVFDGSESNLELTIPLIVSRQTPAGSYSIQSIELYGPNEEIFRYSPSPRGTLEVANSKVMKLSAYESFLERYPRFSFDGNASKEDDPDSDNITNIFEAEYDSDPFQPSVATGENSSEGNQPQIEIKPEGVTFTYKGLQMMTVESSSGLADWDELPNSHSNQDDSSIDTFSAVLPEKRSFVRLRFQDLEIENLSEDLTAEGSAAISWETDELATSQIEYGLTPEMTQTSEIGTEPALRHRIVLSELDLFRTYYYRIRSISENGVLGTSPVRQFEANGTGIDLSTAVLASSFGYNDDDSTEALRSALASSDPLILVDKQAGDWVVGPIKNFSATDKTIVFQDGVTIRAKEGGFPERNNILLQFVNPKNLKIYGYGAHLRMNKSEYVDYEGRHALSIHSGEDVTIEGLTISDSGGDGIYLGLSSNGRNYNENIRINRVVCDNNRRQGMSIISAQNVWVTNCTFSNTKGTLPEAGVDLEPNSEDERLVNINFDGCRFTKNNHSGFVLAPQHLTRDSIPVSVSVTNSYFSMNHVPENAYIASEVVLGSGKDPLSTVTGSLEFGNIHFDGSLWGLFHTRKSDLAYQVSFKDIVAENIAQADEGSRAIITFEIGVNPTTSSLGGVSFENTSISYQSDIPVMYVINFSTLDSLKDITGEISIFNPNEVEERVYHTANGPMNLDNVSLDVQFNP